ncbi:MAG TPA: hypothetical protein VGS08_03590 [Candidatus Saccharimonadales bacterium]|nr:hypothetical protein [Candidatus Saccharimonadales bacterium]
MCYPRLYRKRDLNGLYGFGRPAHWAINLELLIARRPALLDAVLYADQSSEEGINRLQREFDAIQPGLLERWRTDISDAVHFCDSGLAMTRHILNTLYGVEYFDPGAWAHMDNANQSVYQLLRGKLQ